MDSDSSSGFLGERPKRLVVLVCKALENETLKFTKNFPHVAAVDVLEMNLHETPLLLKEALQQKIDEAETKYQPDAVALVYGLCGCGLVGIQARSCPVVVPRAHDCVTLYLGTKERYAQLLKDQPQTYWYTPGWIESERSPSPEKMEKKKQEFIGKFDEDDAEFLIEQEMSSLKLYQTGAYIDLGVGDSETNEAFAKRCAEWLGWKFKRMSGDDRLMADLLSGVWDEERFLVVLPGQEIAHSMDDQIMKAMPVPAKV